MSDKSASAHSASSKGKWLRLPRSRRLVVDMLSFSKRVPSQSLVRNCNVAELVSLRKQVSPPISWPAMFIKAMALISADTPRLRQLYMKWPWAHYYEHPHSVCRMTISREYGGEEWVMFAHFEKPEAIPIAELSAQVLAAKEQPFEENWRYRFQTKFAAFPTVLRRLAWWVSLNVSGTMRANRFGTFGMTTVSSWGAISIHPPCLGMPILTFGPVDREGNVRVTLVYDHRALDGGQIAQYLRRLEETLNGEIAEEIRGLMSKKSATEGRAAG